MFRPADPLPDGERLGMQPLRGDVFALTRKHCGKTMQALGGICVFQAKQRFAQFERLLIQSARLVVASGLFTLLRLRHQLLRGFELFCS